ncbi:hypothetical protein F4825DRAFT_460808 [Nemania diffusa]|nr:hypothetical protein F4825DRAFT_460808 [Nemania diffusa]
MYLVTYLPSCLTTTRQSRASHYTRCGNSGVLNQILLFFFFEGRSARPSYVATYPIRRVHPLNPHSSPGSAGVHIPIIPQQATENSTMASSSIDAPDASEDLGTVHDGEENVRLREDSVNLTYTVPCLMSINGKVCGSPDDALIREIGRFAINTSIGFSARFIYNQATIPRFRVLVIFRFSKLGGSYESLNLGLIDIPFNQELPAPRIAFLKSEEAKKELSQFGDTLSIPFEIGCTILELKPSKVLVAINERRVPANKPEIKEQIAVLKKALDSAVHNPFAFQFFFNGDHTQSENGIERSLYQAIKGIRHFHGMHAKGHDFLSKWFALCKNTHALTEETVIRLSKENQLEAKRPMIDAMPAQHQFASKDELSVALAYGLIDQFDMEQAHINERNAQSFKCHFAGLKNLKSPNDLPEALILVVTADSKELRLLPPKGKKLKCCIEGLERQPNEPRLTDKVEKFMHIISDIFEGEMDAASRRSQLSNYTRVGNIEERNKVTQAFMSLHDIIVNGNTTDPKGELRQLVATHLDVLSAKDGIVLDGDEHERLKWFNGERLDFNLPELGSKVAAFILKIPKEPKAEADGGDRRPINVQIPVPSNKAAYKTFLQTEFWETTSTCQFREELIESPTRRDITGLAELLNPRSVQDAALQVSEYAQNIYNWSTDFRDYKPLEDESNGKEDVPEGLLRWYGDLDQDQKDGIENLKTASNSMVSVVGCFGSGIEIGDPDSKILWVAPNNSIIDDLPAKYNSLCERYGFEDYKSTCPLRVYSLPKELKAGTKLIGQKFTEFNQATSAKDAEKATGDNEDEIGAIEHFMAVKMLDDCWSRHRNRSHPHKNFANSSLHVSVFPELYTLWKSVETNDILAETTYDVIKDVMLDMYRSKLGQARSLRTFFRPNTLIFDEAARMHEITLFSTIAGYPTVTTVIQIGDPNQLKPYTGQPHIDAQLPFGAQVSVSNLERIDVSGVTTIPLMTNHRQFADLYKDPGAIIYQKPLHANAMLKEYFHPEVPKRQNLGSSWTDPVHIDFACMTTNAVMSDQKFTGPEDLPGTVSLLCIKAGMAKYIDEILPGMHRPRLSVRSVDSSQGFEADINIIFMSRDPTKGVGFCGDMNRLNVWVWNSACLSVYPYPYRNPECMYLKKLFDHVERRQGSFTIQHCKTCSGFDAGHELQKFLDNTVCAECNQPGHTHFNCPKTVRLETPGLTTTAMNLDISQLLAQKANSLDLSRATAAANKDTRRVNVPTEGFVTSAVN